MNDNPGMTHFVGDDCEPAHTEPRACDCGCWCNQSDTPIITRAEFDKLNSVWRLTVERPAAPVGAEVNA